MEEKRLAVIEVSSEMLLDLLREGNPELKDAQPRECFADPWTRRICFVFYSPHFREVEEGNCLPRLGPMYLSFDRRTLTMSEGKVTCPLCKGNGCVEEHCPPK